MLSYIKNYDVGKEYQSAMLFKISIIWSVVIGVIVSIGFIFFPMIWYRWLTFLFLAILMAVFTNFFIKKGYVNFASWAFVVFLWLFISIPCLTAGGIRAPGIVSQLSVILTAGFLLSWRGGLFFGVLSVVADLGFVLMEMNDVLPVQMVFHTPITLWIGAIIPFGTVIALQHYSTIQLRTSLIDLQKEILTRKEVEKLKDDILYNLNERVKEQRTLYNVSHILHSKNVLGASEYDEIVKILSNGWQYPEITAAKLQINDTYYATENFQESKYKLKKVIQTKNRTKVGLEIVYLKSMPIRDEGPFIKEERYLIDALVELLKTDIERREHLIELNDYKYAIDIGSNVSISDVEGNFIYLNENYVNTSKYSREELLGKNFLVLLSEESKTEEISRIKEVLESGKEYRGEFCNVAKDGSKYWFDSTIIPFVNDKGEVYQYLSLNYDITLKKLANEKIIQSEQLLRKITSQVPGNTYMFEIDEWNKFRFLFMSRGKEKHNHDLTYEILKENPDKFFEMVVDEDKNKISKAIRISNIQKSEIDLQFRINVNGEIRWRWMQASPEMNQSGVCIWYCVTTDITPLVNYISSIEQIIFDIAHVIRRPIVNIIGLSSLLNDFEIEKNELTQVYKRLSSSIEDLNSFTKELNEIYNELRVKNQFSIEFSDMIDKRISLFKYK